MPAPRARCAGAAARRRLPRAGAGRDSGRRRRAARRESALVPVRTLGRLGRHKGIDIFAPKGRRVVAATYGLVLLRGEIERGGKVVLAPGPKWRLHYSAHLDTVQTGLFTPLLPSMPLGTVGDSGNAAGKPPHLHYSVVPLLPLPWKATTRSPGWTRAFYLDPGEVVAAGGQRSDR